MSEEINDIRVAKVTVNNGVSEVTVDEVFRTLGKIRLIDVRRSDEFNNELGHIKNAELVTLGSELMSFLYDADKNQEIVFVCRSGARSDHATREAQAMGFKYVSNMVGGMLLWNEKKYPIEREE